MADGGEVAAAVVVALPGHMMPPNADPTTEAGFTAWVNSIHPKFVEQGLADKLIEEGYDSVATSLHVDEDELRSVFDMKTAHARVFVAAAQAVCRARCAGVPVVAWDPSRRTPSSTHRRWSDQCGARQCRVRLRVRRR